MLSQNFGARQTKRIEDFLQTASWLILLVSGFFITALLTLSEPLILLFVDEQSGGEMVAMATELMAYVWPLFLFAGANMLISGYLTAIHLPFQSGVVALCRSLIFPGGFLPSINVLAQHLTEHSELVIESLDDIGLDYAKTLSHWRDNFLASWSTISTLGYDETFKRLWLYYLAYCEGAFLERSTSTVHLVARK